MHTNDISTDPPQFDTCIDSSAPASVQERAGYNANGDLDPTLIDENVNCSTCSSTVTLIPQSATHGTASQLVVTPSTGTSKYDLGNGQILVTFAHPGTDCGQNVWTLAFGSGLGVSLTVKLRKVSVGNPQDPTDAPPDASSPASVSS